MSGGFAAVPNWLVRDPSASAHEKLIYLVLSSHIGDQGAWFMSHAQIAEMAGISVASVKRALTSLRERGVISWVTRKDPKSGAQLGNSYRLMTDRLGQGERPPSSQGATPPLSVSDQNKNPEKEPRETPPTPSADDEAFEALWMAWPKKVKREEALRAWKRLPLKAKNEALPLLVAHANAYRQHTAPRFIPGLAPFLNGKRWHEDLAVSEERGAYRPEPKAPSQRVIPQGHIPVRDEYGQIIGSRPAS